MPDPRDSISADDLRRIPDLRERKYSWKQIALLLDKNPKLIDHVRRTRAWEYTK